LPTTAEETLPRQGTERKGADHIAPDFEIQAASGSILRLSSLVLAGEPTASLDTGRAFQAVEAFANLIHENQRASIMVTHDLRMVRYVGRVLHMRDDKLVKVIQDSAESQALARDEIN